MACLFVEEKFCQAERPARDIAGVVIADQSEALFADFREVDFPRFAGKVLRVVAWRTGRLLGATGRLLLMVGLMRLICLGIFWIRWGGGAGGGIRRFFFRLDFSVAFAFFSASPLRTL